MLIYSGVDPQPLLDQLPARYSHIVRDQALATPDAPAVYFNDLCVSYRELWSQVEAVIDLLRQEGARGGDRVQAVGENGLQVLVVLLAISEIDAWGVPVNARMSVREVEVLSDCAEPRLSVFCVEDSSAAAQLATHFDAAQRESAIGRIAIVGQPEVVPEPVHASNANQCAVMVFTSGTTGQPKAVMVSHLALAYMGVNMAQLRGIRASDIFYNSSPISHAIGLGTVAMTAFSAGGSVRMVSRFDPAELCDFVTRGEVTVISGVPMLFSRVLDHAAAKGISLRHPAMHSISVAGAPLDLGLKSRVEQAFGLRLDNSYGMTEFNPIARSAGGVVDTEVGELQPGVEIRLVDPEGNDVASSEAGEVWVRGPQRSLGYYRNESASADAVRGDGWLATGDLAAIDDQDRLRIVGRSKDLIIRSGFNVHPVEVESVIAELDGVSMVAVVPRPTSDNEEVVAYVQPFSGVTLDPDVLSAAVRDRLAPYKRPTIWRIERELPVGPTGKILKIRLKEIEAESARTEHAISN